ncbi:Ku protein [Streptomyces castrisilvae]|uniref:Non-homologous end joining protein Ku n=1 Tax=Streptomyces castrisilvae TaxID=3033811 RepID=A0ABY9HP09_9ACTN|nr:Ku protein [Streptomyces sp. Mut1]WLQ36280.1 Ku protein [Streptomyces sp. Mut1]
MRSIWNGAISFGLVSIPIKLVNATENHSVSFRQIHVEDGGRIRYRKVCELDGEEVAPAEIGKAYEDADGTMIPITDEDLGKLPLPTAKTIEIVAFVPADAIDPLQMDAAYYLSANGVPAAKPYTLLREALKRSRKVALAKYALRGRERLGMLRVVGDVIAMHGLLWPDEIRAPEGVAPESDVTVRDAELDLADALMDTLGEVDMDSLHDDYREAVEEMIAAKASGEVPEPAEKGSSGGGKVIDLIAALESSVRAAKEARGEEGEGGEENGGENGEGERPVAGVTSISDRKASGGSRKKAASGSGSGGSDSGGSGSGSGAAKKSAAKSTAKKASAKKPPAKKAASNKGTAKKAAAKKSPAKKQSTAKSGTSRKRASA